MRSAPFWSGFLYWLHSEEPSSSVFLETVSLLPAPTPPVISCIATSGAFVPCCNSTPQLTGPALTSDAKKPNKIPSFLQLLNLKPEFEVSIFSLPEAHNFNLGASLDYSFERPGKSQYEEQKQWETETHEIGK